MIASTMTTQSSTAMISIVIVSLLCSLAASASCSSSDPASGLMTSGIDSFVLFAGSGYTFAGGVASTTINGDIGSFPTATPLSSNPMVVLNGVEQLNNSVTGPIALDVKTAYNNAMAKMPRNPISGDIGGLTLTAGTYYSESTIGITGNITLDANNDENAVFLIISGSATFFAPYSTVILVNGAQSCRVFWVFGSSATINAYSTVIGNLNAYASITVGSGSTITGSLLASAAISLDNVTITAAPCSLSQTSLEPCTSSLETSQPPPVNGLTSSAQATHLSFVVLLVAVERFYAWCF